MHWVMDKKRPLCPQICEQLCVRIACGVYAPGEKLISVRELAVEAGVNPNTVQSSFTQLEQQGIVYSVRGLGWFVDEDITAAKRCLEELIKEKTQAYFQSMQALGMHEEEIKDYVKEWKG